MPSVTEEVIKDVIEDVAKKIDDPQYISGEAVASLT